MIIFVFNLCVYILNRCETDKMRIKNTTSANPLIHKNKTIYLAT